MISVALVPCFPLPCVRQLVFLVCLHNFPSVVFTRAQEAASEARLLPGDKNVEIKFGQINRRGVKEHPRLRYSEADVFKYARASGPLRCFLHCVFRGG